MKYLRRQVMYQTDSWRILAPSQELTLYAPEDIIFHDGFKIRKSLDLNKHIEESWKIEQQKSPNIKPGKLLRLEKLKECEYGLDLWVNLTDYPEYKATCIPEHTRRFRPLKENEKAHTFASATLPITLDDKVVFLQRGDNVDMFKNWLNLPSGGKWDGNPEETIKDMLEGRNAEPIFRRCRQIVINEFNNTTPVENNYSQNMYGVAQTLEYNENPFDDHVMLFSITLLKSAKEILKEKEKLKEGKKYQDLVIVDFDEAKLADFLNANLERIPDSIQPVVVMAGARKFGKEWPLYIKGVRKK